MRQKTEKVVKCGILSNCIIVLLRGFLVADAITEVLGKECVGMCVLAREKDRLSR